MVKDKVARAKYSHDYYIANKEKMDKRSKAYIKGWHKINKTKVQEYKKQYRLNNLIKTHAHDLLNRALKRGDIVKPLECENCNQDGRLEAHHSDYNKPLDVNWLCGSCHKQEHLVENK